VARARQVTRLSESKTGSVAAIGDSRVIPAEAGIQRLFCVISAPRFRGGRVAGIQRLRNA
jgi:hypothetical protein